LEAALAVAWAVDAGAVVGVAQGGGGGFAGDATAAGFGPYGKAQCQPPPVRALLDAGDALEFAAFVNGEHAGAKARPCGNVLRQFGHGLPR